MKFSVCVVDGVTQITRADDPPSSIRLVYLRSIPRPWGGLRVAPPQSPGDRIRALCSPRSETDVVFSE
jgi:hypothetical protein